MVAGWFCVCGEVRARGEIRPMGRERWWWEGKERWGEEGVGVVVGGLDCSGVEWVELNWAVIS